MPRRERSVDPVDIDDLEQYAEQLGADALSDELAAAADVFQKSTR